jgi:hypothetical protein
MSTRRSRLSATLILMMAMVLSLGVAQTTAQTLSTQPPPDASVTDPETGADMEGEDPAGPSTANPPAYIGELMKATELKQAQIDQMRAAGMGWGEVRISTRLAEKIAADSSSTLTFDAALEKVLAERAAGKGFGQIASENNLKLGELLKKGGKEGAGGQETATASKEKKPGLFARFGRFLGFGKSADRPSRPATVDGAGALAKGGKPERFDRSAKVERPEKLSKPERPAKPEKPDKPEKGPHR